VELQAWKAPARTAINCNLRFCRDRIKGPMTPEHARAVAEKVTKPREFRNVRSPPGDSPGRRGSAMMRAMGGNLTPKGFPMRHANYGLNAALSQQLDQYFVTLGQGFNAYTLGRAHRRKIDYLDRLSDSDLAHLGIRRDEIVRHVFRDRFAR
jgi:uncharacterized protein YjiS (DUF1127 family)